MFLRYIAAVLMFSSLSMYANPNNSYAILQKWDREEAEEGELSVLMEHVNPHPINDFWREKELLKELSQRGTLYDVIGQHKEKTNSPNSRRLNDLSKTTLEHHRNLLYHFRHPVTRNTEVENTILKAFPELETK